MALRLPLLARRAVAQALVAASATAGPAAAWPPSAELLFARQEDSGPMLWRWSAGSGWNSGPLPAAAQAPLGSVWKLFVYAYLRDKETTPEDYRCTGKQPKQEIYCCSPGGSIGREAALLQSCGLYFDPQRLGLRAANWSRYWRAADAPAWLMQLERINEDSVVPVASLLQALARMPEPARHASQQALLALPLSARGQSTLGQWGTRVRGKTWSMPNPARPGSSWGGLAGWQADGKAVWLQGPGSSKAVLTRAATPLATLLQGQTPPPGPCVDVAYFSRYPLRQVLSLADGSPLRSGRLHGRYRLLFQSGSQLDIAAQGELTLQPQPLAIHGRLDLNEYVARVVDREGQAEPAQAARALAVLARSYLLQQGATGKGCYRIADSSASQRVAPRAASAAALDAAAATDGLVLAGMPARYHGDDAGPGRLSWQEAVADAQQGLSFDAILARRFTQARLALTDGDAPTACEPLPQAERWLQISSRRWQARLRREPGFEAPETLTVCRLQEGKPYTDFNRRRIHVRGLQSQEDRITLAHEYLHLAFAQHPTGADETAVETLARQLLGVGS